MIYHNLQIEPLGVCLSVANGTLLSDVLKSFNVEFPCGGKGLCGNCNVRILSGNVSKSERHLDILKSKSLDEDWCISCLTVIEDNLKIEIPQGQMVIQVDDNSISANISEQGFAISVDIGSTTIVVQLVNMQNGEVLGTRTGLNPQSAYGADIISRIAYSISSKESSLRMTNIIRTFVGDMIGDLYAEFGNVNIRKIKLVGNTVMHHLFIGHDVKCLASAPFNSDNNSSYVFSHKELGWNIPYDCLVEFLPNISHFVGSDILAGIMSCGMSNSNKYVLLVDLGTNGEIVLGNKDNIWCTSTAAGPAFEGINISCGMRASSGAISEVSYCNGKFEIVTIDNVRPIGLCGSGLVDAVFSLLENRLIDCMGTIVDEQTESFILAEGVKLSAGDIREFQLAKSAIAAGIQLLMKYASISVDDIDCVFITGGLGNYVNYDKLRLLGLIPEIKSEKYRRISNAALSGCKLALYDSEYLKINDILKKIKYCPLESDVDFMDYYCNNMYFPM